MNNEKRTNQQEQKSARPPEYTIIRRATNPVNTAPQQPQQPQKTRRSKRDVRSDESESRREQRREQRYRAQRRKQWILAGGIVVVFIVLLALALHFLTSTNSATNSPNAPSPGGTPSPLAALSIRF